MVTSVSVTGAPVISLPTSTTVCGTGSVTLNAGGSASTYSWSTGATTSSISVSPTMTTTSTVTATGSCETSSAVTTVSQGTAPTVTAASSATTTCSGSPVTLTASGTGGSSYSWNTGATTASITVSPTVSTVYTVTATNSCGTATSSISQNVVVCTGLNEWLNAELRLYPNPASDLVYISLSPHLLSGTTHIEITDALGKLALKELLNKDVSTVKLDGLEHGIYFFRILFHDELIKTGKMVKQ